METNCKGDLYRTLLEDLKFIIEEKNDEHRVKMIKYNYKKNIYGNIEQTRF